MCIRDRKWADKKGFSVEVLDYLDGDEAGVKSVTFQVNGEKDVYKRQGYRCLDKAFSYRRIRHHGTFVAHVDEFLRLFIIGNAGKSYGLDFHAPHLSPVIIQRICHIFGQLPALGGKEGEMCIRDRCIFFCCFP